MSESDDRIDFLRQLFDHYLALPRHKADADFIKNLQSLQQWETEDIRRRHALTCSDNPHYATVLNFYLGELHQGLRLDGMINSGPQGIENARRLDKAYQLFANAIEFSVLSAEIQDQVAVQLGNRPITPGNYAKAVLACDNLTLRERRLKLLVEIGHEVSPHLGSRMMHTGLKLLKPLFRTIGLAEIHQVADQGFRQLRSVPRLPQTLAQFAETEKAFLKELPAS